jgi:hypothetical protein
MNKQVTLFFLILLYGCHLPNSADPPEFRFTFNGRLEKLEDAFYALHFNYEETDFSHHLLRKPEYELTITRGDTIIAYLMRLVDCESMYYLVNFSGKPSCDTSYIDVEHFFSNIDSLPASVAQSIFKNEVIDKITEKHSAIKNRYQLNIERYADSVIVKVVNQNNILRKKYFYTFDTVENKFEERTIINYLVDSTIIYQKSKEQYYIYIYIYRI